MRLKRLVLIGGLAIVASTRPVVAQTEGPSRSFLVYVTPTQENVRLSPSEHLLIFHMPVQIPGASLPPGAYIFRLLGPSILQVTNATRAAVYSTFFTLDSSGDGDDRRERVRFEQHPEDNVPRIVGWYLPGGLGYEFLYPRTKRKPVERGVER
jgi:hypothetical protein